MINEELVCDFVEEASVHAATIEQCLLQLTHEIQNLECINEIFRAVHSIKGTAGFFKLNKIIDISHVMENLFGKIRSNNYELKENDIDILFSANDVLKELIENIYEQEKIEVNHIIKKIQKIIDKDDKKEEKNELEELDDKDELYLLENNIDFKKIDDEILRKAKKHGHKFYVINTYIIKNVKENKFDIEDLKKMIESIGEIIDTYEICKREKKQVNFLISSVLEKNLISIALNIDENEIDEYKLKQDFNKNDKNTKQKEIEEKELIIDQDNNRVMDEVGITFGEDEKEIESNDIFNEKKRSSKNTFHNEESIRVKVSLLNDLLNLTGELVLGRNQLIRTMENHRKDIENIDNILQNIDYVTSNLQSKIMQTRMQPIANVFDKFPRIVRDLSKTLNKNIDLQLEGRMVELDKSIIEELSDPLVHLVRNAADHGLESKEERELKGKPLIGNITLKAYHKAGYVIIDVIDDGKGIDLNNVKKKALEKGIVSKNDLLLMSDKEIIELILKPGFSTTNNITNISGRGVGMDVVKTNIKKLGGNIEIYTKAGKETTIRLIIPLTLAIISSLIVESNNQKFALPQINLKEIVRITPNDTNKKIEYVNNNKVLILREKILPIVTLSEVLGCKESFSEQISKKKIIRMLVLKSGFKEFALIVDEIYDGEEVLVKSLPKYIKDSQCYSGVTILGDGRVAMILDINGIAEKAKLKLKDDSRLEKQKNIERKNQAISDQRNLLLFQCSKNERFALDLSFVKRVEEINCEDIELIGDKEYIKIRGNSLRIIRPSNYMPISQSEKSSRKYYVIIPKLVKHPVGILINKVIDTVERDVKLNNNDVNFKGILGSTIINNKITLVLNIYELFEMALPEKYKITYVNETVRKQKVILLVEDTEVFLKQEKSYIESAGYKVITAKNGREALETLQESKVDLVVSDIIMPVMDGLELVKKIKKNVKFRNIPVIALTSITFEEKKREGLDSGFDAYEYKLDREALIETIEKFLNKEV